MNPEIELLTELQELDREIMQKRGELDQLKPRAIEVQKRLKEGTERVTREQAELKDLRKNLDLTRLEIGRLDAAIKHYEDQQVLIRTTKEMAALNHELATSRDKKKQLEAETASMQSRREQIERDIEELEGSAEALRQHCENEIADIKGEAEQLKTELKSLRERQAATRSKLEADLLDEYDDLNNKYPGSVLVDARDGSCLGCNMELIPQLKIELKLGKKTIHCHRCGRILRRDLDFTPKADNEA